MAAKYERIAAELRHKIQAGQLRPGSQMPAQTALASQYKVSLPTIQQALTVLETEGLIEAVQGIGTYVRTPRPRIRRTPERYQWEKSRALLGSADERLQSGAAEHDTGLAFEDLDFYAEYRTEDADTALADSFNVEPGTKLLHRFYRTTTRTDASALSLIDSYLIYDMISKNPDLLNPDKEPWPGGTHHQLRTIGIEIDKITDEITARPPQREEAELLGISQGISVLVIRKISWDLDGRVVELSNVVLPGDRSVMVYETQLERWPK